MRLCDWDGEVLQVSFTRACHTFLAVKLAKPELSQEPSWVSCQRGFAGSWATSWCQGEENPGNMHKNSRLSQEAVINCSPKLHLCSACAHSVLQRQLPRAIPPPPWWQSVCVKGQSRAISTVGTWGHSSPLSDAMSYAGIICCKLHQQSSD